MDRKVYLLFTDTGTIFTRMIKLYTKKPYNHASISLDSHLLSVYSFGRKNPKNPFIGGFVQENIESELFNDAECAIYCCDVSECQFEKMAYIIRKMEEHKHQYRYNLLGLFAILLNIQLQRKNSYFCSQFVATVLKECEIVNISKPVSLVTPYDIQELPRFQIVYRGSLKNYINKTRRRENKHINTQIVSGF